MPELTVSGLVREAEQEAAVLAQAVNIEILLNISRSFDPGQDNLTENEAIQVRTCLVLLHIFASNPLFP